MSGVHASAVVPEADEPGGDDPLGADELGGLGRARCAEHEAEGERHHRRARLERRVVLGELQELGHDEDRAEERERREADRQRADAEPRVAEQAEVEHRRRGA
jgi:hypothetical protein